MSLIKFYIWTKLLPCFTSVKLINTVRWGTTIKADIVLIVQQLLPDNPFSIFRSEREAVIGLIYEQPIRSFSPEQNGTAKKKLSSDTVWLSRALYPFAWPRKP